MHSTADPAGQSLKTKAETAKHLHISERGVERLVADGVLKAVRLRGRVLFSPAAIDECIRRNEG